MTRRIIHCLLAGGVQYTSGTSFASPYIAAVLALWLQHKQRQAASQRTDD